MSCYVATMCSLLVMDLTAVKRASSCGEMEKANHIHCTVRNITTLPDQWAMFEGYSADTQQPHHQYLPPAPPTGRSDDV